MDVRILTLNTRELFVVLKVAVAGAAKSTLPTTLRIGPFNDDLLIKHGFWMRGPNGDILKAIKYLEKELKAQTPPVWFVWSAEPLADAEAKTQPAAPNP